MAVYPYGGNHFAHGIVEDLSDARSMNESSDRWAMDQRPNTGTMVNRPQENSAPVTGFVAVLQNTEMELGEPRDETITVAVRRTYPAMYNHVVRNMNSINYQTKTKKKWSMRGGHFFLYRYIIVFAVLLCLGFGIASIYIKPLATVPFVLSVLYIVLSIFNIVVFIRNRPIIHPILAIQVSRGQLDGMINRFFLIPINAHIQIGVIAAFVNPEMIFTALSKENIQVTEIEIMLYDDRYLPRSRFPKEILIHLFLFIVMLILAIVFVSITIVTYRG
jgi:hypothetical protein